MSEFRPPKKLKIRERDRRTAELWQEVWQASQMSPNDPGLRDRYHEIKRLPIHLICLPMGKEVNHGGMLRLAEAFRVSTVTFANEPDSKAEWSGHRGGMFWQPHDWLDPNERMLELQQSGVACMALTLSDRAVSIDDVSFSFPVALVIGQERRGVPAEMEARCDGSVAIPLFGMTESLNVVCATAIALQTIVGQLQRHGEAEPVRNLSRALLGLPPVDYRD